MDPVARNLLVGAAAIVALSGCVPSPEPDDPAHEVVVLEPPAGTDDIASIASAVDRRLEAAGVPHSVTTRGTQVRVSFDPGTAEVDDELFTMPGEVAIRPVVGTADGDSKEPNCRDAALDAPCTGADETVGRLNLGPAAMAEADIAETAVSQDRGDWRVEVTFTDGGRGTMEKLSADAACARGPQRRIAYLVDGAIVAAPQVELECGKALLSTAAISGTYTHDEVRRLAASMAAELPPGVKTVSTRP